MREPDIYAYTSPPHRRIGAVKVIALILLAVFLPAAADDEEVPEADIVPLPELLVHVREQFQGRLLEVELDDEDDGWVYEIKLLSTQGNVLELEYDAGTMELLEVRGRRDTPRGDGD